MDEDVAQFIAVTNCEVSEAEYYLGAAAGDIDAAISIYLESAGAQRQQDPPPPREPPRVLNNAIEISDDEEGGEEEEEQLISSHSSPLVVQRGFRTMMEQIERNNVGPRNLLDQMSEPFRDFEAESVLIQGINSNNNRTLGELFRPPYEILYRGTFEQARQKAKDDSKWLLVNVQDSTEFTCQVLNRDLWKDKIVQEIVTESFIFVQFYVNATEGQRYTTFYPVNSFPHIAIIDPKTGERLQIISPKLAPLEFVGELTLFLDKHTAAATATATSTSNPGQVDFLTEDEALQIAIDESLSAAIPDGFHEICELPAVDWPEPQTDATRIQIRMPDGTRVIRKFGKNDLVSSVYSVVKFLLPSIGNKPFDLLLVRDSLAEKLNMTISGAGICNSSLSVTLME